MEYTKGEWEAYRNALGTWAISSDYEPIAQVERHYNAHLISAAPDLYKACKSAYAWYYEGQTGDYKTIGEYLRQALAKVEGDQR